jgi:hypothetical protein
VYDGVLAANEMIFIPAGSAHQVANLPGATTVAIAMNYVDIANVDRFLNRVRDMSRTVGESGHRATRNIVDMFEGMELTHERGMLAQALQGKEVGMPPSMNMKEFKHQQLTRGRK